MEKYLLYILFFGFYIVKAQTNNPPVLTNPFDDISTFEDENFSFIFSVDLFTDPDENDEITYDAQMSDGASLPQWLSFDNSLLSFSGVPSNEDVGVLNIQIIATDLQGASATFDFKLEVINTNDPPYVQGNIDPIHIQEDEYFEYVFSEDLFADDDIGDELSYSALLSNGNELPAWLIFDNASKTFSGTPENNAVGDWEIRLTATDVSGEKVSLDFSLSVTNVNDPPVVINTIPEQKVEQNKTFSYTVPDNIFEDYDPDDKLELSASLADGSNLPDWLSFDNSENTFSGTPSEINVYNIKLTASDLSGDTVSTNFKLTVYQITGINQYKVDELIIYPNPSNGVFNIQLMDNDFSNKVFLSLKNTSGATIWTSLLNSNKEKVQINEIKAGIYFLEFKSKNKYLVKKIIIER
ncbi:MAG: putative Ig domain-containing protein [Bacteroidales bacterium]|nr:putative Ig domain-containing protein [Bacteroidales bacterium]